MNSAMIFYPVASENWPFSIKASTIFIDDERFDKSENYFYEGGIVSFVEYLNKRHTVLHEPVFIEGYRNDVSILK
jgi:DNA gyrase subunit B